MFGSKKTADVRLTKKQLEEALAKMTPSERKRFKKRQREMEEDRFEDAFMMGLILGEDE